MVDWLTRFGEIVALNDRVRALGEGVAKLTAKIENHNERIVRLETIVEVVGAGGSSLRIAPPQEK